MASLAQIRNKANTKLAEFWPTLVEKQQAYLAKHGRYFQLLVTNTSVDGADVDFVRRLPLYEENGADIDTGFFGQLPFVLEVHQNGDKGFTTIARVQVNGKTYQRIHSYAEGITENWHQIYSPEEELTRIPTNYG